jgi:1-deoxy-D-xylulose-5-phosphate reductoisomerase
MRGVALLGCTGSIGRSALNVLQRHADEFRVVALAAHRSAPALAALCREHRPSLAVLVDAERANGTAFDGVRLATGREALLEAATHPDADIVINAVVGAAGLEATLAALRAGKRLALANKESLVAGGPLVMDALAAGGGELVPIDSEHSAVLQCIAGLRTDDVRRIVLTASGGPFRDWPRERIAAATCEQALQHPTWDMGAKITIDSASLANKALEVIEAHFLFGLPYDRIDVVVHPQSIVHSMVETRDGSMLAQLGVPSMELPILYALSHPERRSDAALQGFDPVTAGTLTFERIDEARFPTFALGCAAGRAGGTAPAVFNAANEAAVAAFLQGRLPFGGIAETIDHVLAQHVPTAVDSLETVRAADRAARDAAEQALKALC